MRYYVTEHAKERYLQRINPDCPDPGKRLQELLAKSVPASEALKARLCIKLEKREWARATPSVVLLGRGPCLTTVLRRITAFHKYEECRGWDRPPKDALSDPKSP